MIENNKDVIVLFNSLGISNNLSDDNKKIVLLAKILEQLHKLNKTDPLQ